MIIDSSRQEFGLGISMSSFSAPEVWGLNWKTQRQEVNLSKGACICVREKEREREKQRQRDKDREITPVNCHVNVRRAQTYMSFLPHSFYCSHKELHRIKRGGNIFRFMIGSAELLEKHVGTEILLWPFQANKIITCYFKIDQKKTVIMEMCAHLLVCVMMCASGCVG